MTSANSSRDTALTLASANGQLEFVKLLLEFGARDDVRTSEGNSPRWHKVNGQLEFVKLLLEFGARDDVRTSEGNSPRWFAKGGHREVVELLKDEAEKAAIEIAKELIYEEDMKKNLHS